jgi:hypothetical protein
MFDSIRRWFNRLMYRYYLWRVDRQWRKQKRVIGKALAPVFKEVIKGLTEHKF